MNAITKKEPPVPKRPKWWIFYTGGLLTTGGLGWCLRLAYIEKPKEAMLSYLAGSAGICLMNMAVTMKPGKTPSEVPVRNWLMLITGGIISGTGFGYCLSFALKQHPKSTLISYTVGSIGYIMANTVLYTMSTEKTPQKMNMQDVYNMIESSRFNFKSNVRQCNHCDIKDEGGLKREMPRRVNDKKERSDRSTENEKYENKNSNRNQLLKKYGNEAYSAGKAGIVRAPDFEASMKQKTDHLLADSIGDEDEKYCGPTNFPNLFPDVKSTLTANKLEITGTRAVKSTDETTDSQSESDTEAELAEKQEKIISDNLGNISD